MRHQLVVILFLITVLANGQGFKREYKLTNSVNNVSRAVFETTPNNYFMGGIVVDTLNGITFNRLALFGINTLGQRTWTKKYGSNKFEYLDNAFITRCFYKQGDYIYHVGCALDSNNKFLGVFIKFNLTGDTLWQKRFYETNYDVVPQMVTGSMDGGFLMTGYCQQTGNQPVLLIKTDANGNELWRKLINKTGPNVHDGKAILQDTLSKKIVIAGYQYIGTTTKDNFLICDSLGVKISQQNFTGSLGGWIYDLIQTKDKKVVAVGRAIYPQTIGGNNLTRSFVVKFDLNSPSLPIWKIDNYDKLALGNSFLCLREMKNENLLIAGGIDTMVQNSLPRQSFNRLTKIDKNGNVVWNRNYNYTKNVAVNNDQSINSLEIANNGDWLTAVRVPNNSPNPFFFVRYDSTGCDSSISYCSSVGLIERRSVEEAISVYPNPLISVINVNFSNLNLSGALLTFKIVDVMGRIIKEDEIKIENERAVINFNEFNKGIYSLQLFNATKLIASKKVVKE